MAGKAGAQGSVPIAKLLAVEAQVNKLTSEMEKLILISTQHGSRIKELIIASSNSVSQVEMMSTVTTTRFQHMNDLKTLRKNLQAKYEELSLGGVDHSADEIDNKESKALASKINDVQNEVSNTAFKNTMEMNKLKMELKSSKKDYDELKRYVNALEAKLGTLIEDIQENGIKTAITMDDMPELTYQQSSAPRRASILSPDAGGPGPVTVPHTAMHPFTHIHQPHRVEPVSHQTFPETAAGSSHSPFQMHTSGAPMDPEIMQQMQLQYQQQMYFQHQAAQQHAQNAGSMPMTDSGLSTAAHSPSLSRHPSLTVNSSATQINHAHRIMHQHAPHFTHTLTDPHSQYPGPLSYDPYPYALPSSTSAVTGGAADREALQLQNLSMPTLSKEDRYYKAQFKAMKELIIASMECRDLRELEPEGVHTKHRNDSQQKNPTSAASSTTVTATNTAGTATVTAACAPTTIASTITAVVKESPQILQESNLGIDNKLCNVNDVTDLRSRTELLEAFDLRHRNRDLYRNMRKVKETEKISMNYADFCVSNVVNKMDSLSYGKFQRKLQETELERLYAKQENQCEVQTQTEESRLQQADTTALATATATGICGEGQQKQSAGGNVSVATPAASGLVSLQQLREQSRVQDSSETDLLTQLTIATRAALDFGAPIEPTHIQYSSTGRRASLLQMGCVFEQDLRDPALRFLDTSFAESSIEEEKEFCDSSSEEEDTGAGVSSNCSSPAQTKRPSVQVQSTTKARMSAVSRPSIHKTNTNNTAARRFIESEKENVEIQRAKQELKALMDRKLLKLYQGLDDRWKGLDQTNLNILQKLGKFQDVLVTLNADSQRLQTTVQLLTAKLAKVDSRMIDAMEPVYVALDAQKSNMSSLEELMVEVSKQLQQRNIGSMGNTGGEEAVAVEESHRRFTAEMSLSDMMALHRPPQLPIETLLRNSRQTATTSRQRNSSEDYILEPDFHATVPASTSLSEHEVEQLLRQLKQYAGLYEDMLHNYQLLTKRLCAEDRRNSGNFSKKRANLPGSVQMRERAYTPQETGSIGTPLPLLSPRPPSTPARTETHSDIGTTATLGKDVVVRLPHTSGDDSGLIDTERSTQRGEACSPQLGPESPDSPCVNVTTTADVDGTHHSMLHTHTFPSPHRVLTDPFRVQQNLHNLASKETISTTRSAKLASLTQRELLQLLEKSDLSTNAEIIRIKSELLLVQQALRTRSANSPTNKTRVLQPPSVFPSLFSSLNEEDFTMARTQVATPAGSVVRAKTPGGSKRPTSSQFSQSSGYRLSPAEVHSSQRQHPPGLILQSSPSRSGTVRLAAGPPEFEDSLLSGTADSHGPISSSGIRGDMGIPLPADSAIGEAQSRYPQYEGVGVAETGSIAAAAAVYTPLAVEDEDGLSEASLSAYDYLIRPAGAQELVAPAPVSAGSAVNEQSFTGIAIQDTTIVASSDTTSRPRVTIVRENVDLSPQPTVPVTDGSPRTQSRGSMWGSAARIGHTSMNAKLNPSAGLPSTARTSLLVTAAGNGRLKTPGSRGGSPRVPSRQSHSAEAGRQGFPQGPGSTATPTAGDAISRVDLLLRAEAVASGEMKGFALMGSVRTAPVSTPTPPIKARPSLRGTGNMNSQRSAGTGQVRTGGASSHHPAEDNYSTSSSSNAVWMATQHSNNDGLIGGTVGNTPSVLLQGGEFFLEEESSVVNHSGGNFPAEVLLSEDYKPMGSVGSYPQNNSANLGENAFD